MHANVILLFNTALYSSILVIKLFESTQYKVVLCRNSYCNTIGQSSFISSATRTVRPLLKLKHSILLVMYTWLNGFYRVMNGKYSITSSSLEVTHDTLRKAPPINSIDRKCRTEKLKGSRTCLIGYSDFISHEWFLITRGAHTNRHTHRHTHTYRCPHDINFKKPGARRPLAGVRLV